MSTIEEIKAAFDTESKALGSLNRALNKERNDIRRRGLREDRDLTDAETTRLEEIAAARREINRLTEKLGAETVELLDNADDVDSLLAELETINQGLSAGLGQLQSLEAYAEKVEKITSGFVSVTGKLLDFRNTLLIG